MRKLLYTALILPATFLVACSDWLDVKPEASVSVEELFESEEGFCEAVNGLYTNATNYLYYGGVATVELMDAMAQNYSFNAGDDTKYAKTAAFDVTDDMFKTRLNYIWLKAYNTIVNCNLILENIESRRGMLGEGIYEIVKGEALAMRAYLHFDLLRLFAAPYSVNPSAPAIPYVTTYSNKVTPMSTVAQVLEYVLKDLNDAKQLLGVADPILDPDYVVGYPENDDEQTETDNPNLFLQNRRHRMNYYAVCATLARAYLWRGDTQSLASAYGNAQEALSGPCRFVDPVDFLANIETGSRDRIMYPELIFAWYNAKNTKNLAERFDDVVTHYFVTEAQAAAIYERSGVGANDRRLQGWFVESGMNNKMQIVKYLRNANDARNMNPMMAPAVRIGEMYFIMAECTYPSDPDTAWQILNIVRVERDISDFASTDFYAELIKEYRKETYGEGQAFFAYKRLGRNIVSELGAVYTPSMFNTFPLPDDEIEFGERN